MNFAEGFAAAVSMIGMKTTGFAVSTATHHAASTADETDRLVWRPLSASRAPDRVGWNLEVHNRL